MCIHVTVCSCTRWVLLCVTSFCSMKREILQYTQYTNIHSYILYTTSSCLLYAYIFRYFTLGVLNMSLNVCLPPAHSSGCTEVNGSIAMAAIEYYSDDLIVAGSVYVSGEGSVSVYGSRGTALCF